MARQTHSYVEADRPVAKRVGARIRTERLRQGLTQSQLAQGRYTKAYVSALENGLIKPSMAALHFLAERLGVPAASLLGDHEARWTRLEADLHLASGDWQAAANAFADLLLEATGDLTRAHLLVGLAEASCRLEMGAEAIRAASESVALFTAAGRAADAARATYWQAFGLYLMENSVEARRLLTGILEQLQAGLAIDPDFNVRVLISLAAVESRDDRGEIAISYLEEARALTGSLDDRRRASYLFTLALTYREVGDFEAALAAGLQALALYRRDEAELEAASVENELALVHLARGSLDVARDLAGVARHAFEKLGNDRWIAHVVDTEAQIALRAGNGQESMALAREALAIAERSNDHKATVSALLSLARAQRTLGDPRAATGLLERAVEMARQHGRRAQLEELLGELADVVAESGNLARAYELSREALVLARSRGAA